MVGCRIRPEKALPSWVSGPGQRRWVWCHPGTWAGRLLGVGEFEEFYRGERDALARLCYLATLDVEAAADAAQEAMLRAWQRWDAVAGGDPAAWVRTVALNLCRSRWRRIQRELRL